MEGAIQPTELSESKEPSPVAETRAVKCPACDSEAVYRYGHTRQGKKRFQCIVCGRQFAADRKRAEIRVRPSCPACGKPMHAYKRESDSLRFRCSGYPQCRTFLKVLRGIDEDSSKA